jgi:hypothetical protein
MAKITPPPFETLNDYYKSYWKYLKEEDLLQALIEQGRSVPQALISVTEADSNFAYAEGKWMLKEVIGHLIDTERILSYRALRFARNDQTPLPGFDENNYMTNSNFRDRTLRDIIDEWKTVREATITLFRFMSEEVLDRSGSANNVAVSPRILLFFIVIHSRHHMQIIKDRYLTSAFSA